MASDTSEAIAKAVKKVEKLSIDENARKEYEMREKALKDYNSVIFDAKAEGIKEGIEKGIREGEVNSKINMIMRLVQKHEFDIDKTMKEFNLPLEYKNQILEKLEKQF